MSDNSEKKRGNVSYSFSGLFGGGESAPIVIKDSSSGEEESKKAEQKSEETSSENQNTEKQPEESKGAPEVVLAGGTGANTETKTPEKREDAEPPAKPEKSGQPDLVVSAQTADSKPADDKSATGKEAEKEAEEKDPFADKTGPEKAPREPKKYAALSVVLAVFFGIFGISDFYCRRTAKGIITILLTLLYAYMALVFRFPEDIMIPIAAWLDEIGIIIPNYHEINPYWVIYLPGFLLALNWFYALLRAFTVPKHVEDGSGKQVTPKDTTPDEAVDFQPDALEIKNSRLPTPVRLCIWIPVVVVVAAILWASIAEVDVVVQTHGRVITDHPTMVVKPFDRVVVKTVHVKVGDIVEKDQVLIEFKQDIYKADLDRLTNDRDTYKAQYDRFCAEFEQKEYKISAEPTRYEIEQLAIFNQRKDYYDARIKSSDASIRYYEEAEKTKLVSLDSMRKQFEKIRELCDKYEKLQENQAASWREYTQMVVTRLEMEGNIATAEQSLQELKNQREATVASRDAFIQEWRNTISENMVKTQSQLKTVESQLTQTEQLFSYSELRSPCRAMVHELASFSENSGVREAEAMITLIPLDDVRIEAEVRPMDIGRISIGSKARIKLDAYPYQKYGTLDGEVVSISENTIQKEQRSMTPEDTSSSYYRAHLDYSGKLKGVSGDFRLIPGMEAQVEIKSGRRKVITYVLYPFIKSLDQAIREP